MMTVRADEGHELVPVENLRPGQEVETMDGGRPIWTKVVFNIRVPATSAFMRIAARQAPHNLTITEEHMSPRLARADVSSFARFDAVMGKDLAVGDWVPVMRQKDIVEADIMSVERIQLPYKNIPETAMATVVANGFLTTTVCEQSPVGQNMSHLVEEWRRTHSALIM